MNARTGFSLLSASLFCALTSLSSASEAVPETISEASGFWDLFAIPETHTLVAAVVSLAAALLVRWGWVRKWRLERAVQCLAAGVHETYEEYVREIQKAREDGKLTAAERSCAMALALDKAKRYALNEGIDMLRIYAQEYLPVLVERIIGVQKAAARGQPLELP